MARNRKLKGGGAGCSKPKCLETPTPTPTPSPSTQTRRDLRRLDNAQTELQLQLHSPYELGDVHRIIYDYAREPSVSIVSLPSVSEEAMSDSSSRARFSDSNSYNNLLGNFPSSYWEEKEEKEGKDDEEKKYGGTLEEDLSLEQKYDDTQLNDLSLTISAIALLVQDIRGDIDTRTLEIERLGVDIDGIIGPMIQNHDTPINMLEDAQQMIRGGINAISDVHLGIETAQLQQDTITTLNQMDNELNSEIDNRRRRRRPRPIQCNRRLRF
jgi:hypothetical protein